MVLLPWPKKVQEQGGNYHLNFKAMIVMDSSCPEGVDVYAQMLQEEISSSTGIKIKRYNDSRRVDCLARAGGADATPVIPPVCGAFACGKD